MDKQSNKNVAKTCITCNFLNHKPCVRTLLNAIAVYCTNPPCQSFRIRREIHLKCLTSCATPAQHSGSETDVNLEQSHKCSAADD